jgi:hypothetical protein
MQVLTATAAAVAGLLLLLATVAKGQVIVGSLDLSASGNARWPSGTGIAKGILYVWCVCGAVCHKMRSCCQDLPWKPPNWWSI